MPDVVQDAHGAGVTRAEHEGAGQCGSDVTVGVAKAISGGLQRDVRLAAIIPARFAAQRLPGKPLASIAGVPMVVRVC
ncbi:MAG TPA: hypothetical protein VH083_14835, partial [Myxococcales bacterium]|nr:hypothetical protein [Myxococcales bacterium]